MGVVATVPLAAASRSQDGVRAGAWLSVDLVALRDNYRRLRQRLDGAVCAAVVKADAYGLGAARVAPALAGEGCRQFFVAHLDEALALRPLLAESCEIFVLNGLPPGAEAEAGAAGVVPVLNSLAQLDAWAALARRQERTLPAVIQVDSGMSRLGLSPAELARLGEAPQRLAGLDLRLVMSHLACADEPAHPANAAQRASFEASRRLLPAAPASLANSSGIFLGPDYHFDLARPGVALYGGNPLPGAANPMRPVVRLEAKVIQVRELPAGAAVGYGYSYRAAAPMRVATISVGYADGWLRSLSNAGQAYFGEVALPLVGRVSMDSVTLDVSALPDAALPPGAVVELLGERQSVDAAAAAAGTIGYEILTSLGHRYHRRYLDG
jgi:alanine racemase